MNDTQAAYGAAKTFQAGTLIYSKSGLFALFGWLLWGDFVFTLMEALMPSLLPILLKANQATTPLIVIFLALVPFAPDIAQWLVARGAGDFLSVGGVAPVIIVFGVLVGGFQIFNMFISSVYYYLIPDVVPGEVIGRFYGLFRICGAAAGIVFNYFIFGLAESHMREIFVTIAVVYGLCILLMCWRVKEGEYPPIVNAKSRSWWSGIATYAKECFGRRYWWWVFLTYGCFVWAGASNVFAVFFSARISDFRWISSAKPARRAERPSCWPPIRSVFSSTGSARIRRCFLRWASRRWFRRSCLPLRWERLQASFLPFCAPYRSR